MQKKYTIFKNQYSIINIQLYVVFSLLFLFLACENTDNNNGIKENEIINNAAPEIEFVNDIHDFGTLIKGEKAECTFVYKNTGGQKLKIISVDAECSCSVPKYDNKGIAGGKTGKIKVTFDSKGLFNNQYKTIKVKTNCDTTAITLIITAFIKTN